MPIKKDRFMNVIKKNSEEIKSCCKIRKDFELSCNTCIYNGKCETTKTETKNKSEMENINE